MDESLKEILCRHRKALVRYINPTPSLINVLVEDKVLPSAMIEDIKKGESKREKNEILLKSMKLRGNISYRKFREAMLKCGQVFIADLLYEEEATGSIVEESDLTSLPSLKLSLSSEEIKQLVHTLDARIRCRCLKADWRKDSQNRMEQLQQRAEDYKSEKAIQFQVAEADQKVKHLTAELNVKNDIIRSLSLDINILNQEILNFTKKHQVNFPFATMLTSGVNENSNMQPKFSRFRFFEAALAVITHKMSSILGEAQTSSSENDNNSGLSTIEVKANKVHEIVRGLEAKVAQMEKDKAEALALLLQDKTTSGCSLVQGVQRFVLQEQKHRYSLLKDIDRLSRKLRDINGKCPMSGPNSLRQSAVTGRPSLEIVDYRFLSNHIALLEADAEHLQKRLGWKEAEIKTLEAEVSGLRKRFNCPREMTSPRFDIPID